MEVLLIRIDGHHAVTVSVNDPLKHVRVDRGGTTDCSGRLDAWVCGSHIPGLRPPAGDTRDAETLSIHLGPGAQEIQTAHAVPKLHTAGRIAPAVPVKPAACITPPVIPQYLAPLDRLNDQTHKPQFGKAPGVGLIMYLLRTCMTAHVKDRRHRLFNIVRDVEIRRHIELRQGFVPELLYTVARLLQRAHHLDIQGRSGPCHRHILKAQHLQALFIALRANLLPLIQRLDMGQGVLRQFCCNTVQVVADVVGLIVDRVCLH